MEIEKPKFKYAYCLITEGNDYPCFTEGKIYEVKSIGKPEDEYVLVHVKEDDTLEENGWAIECFFLFNEQKELDMFKVLYAEKEFV